MKLQEAAKKIEEVLLRMKRDFDTFRSSFRLLGSHLQNAQNRFVDANIAAEQFSVTLDRLQFGSVETQPVSAMEASHLLEGNSELQRDAPRSERDIAGGETV